MDENDRLENTAQNARYMVTCIDCRKPRLLYSTNKLTERQSVQDAMALSEYDYTCGSPVFLPNSPLKNKLHVREHISYEDIIEIPYYTANLNRVDLCCYCAVEDCMKDATLLKQFKTVLPITLHGRRFFHVEKSAVATNRDRADFKTINGTQIIHSVASAGREGVVSIRALPCYCIECLNDNFKDCENKDIVELFKVKQFSSVQTEQVGDNVIHGYYYNFVKCPDEDQACSDCEESLVDLLTSKGKRFVEASVIGSVPWYDCDKEICPELGKKCQSCEKKGNFLICYRTKIMQPKMYPDKPVTQSADADLCTLALDAKQAFATLFIDVTWNHSLLTK
ncbi:hypothetical protein GQR58_013243 [Nymphon striatum]|nr:hypothetical protein GQR58_013243 [Nymphon striatum]